MSNVNVQSEIIEFKKLLARILNITDDKDLDPLRIALLEILINEPATAEMIDKMIDQIAPIIADYLNNQYISGGSN